MDSKSPSQNADSLHNWYQYGHFKIGTQPGSIVVESGKHESKVC